MIGPFSVLIGMSDQSFLLNSNPLVKERLQVPLGERDDMNATFKLHKIGVLPYTLPLPCLGKCCSSLIDSTALPTRWG